MDNHKWKQVWNEREDHLKNEIDLNDKESVFMELKRLDGNDIKQGGVSYKSFIEEEKEMDYLLRFNKKNGSVDPLKSVFEVGCGSGANLYWYTQDKIRVGGIDYSKPLLKVAGSVLDKDLTLEMVYGEATEVPTNIKYDSVISSGVFSYFKTLEYAELVLNKMVEKAMRSIAIMHAHDLDKEEAYIRFREQMDPEYLEHYIGLDKLFYTKDFFVKYAARNNLDILICDSDKEYVTAPFIFNVYLYKR